MLRRPPTTLTITSEDVAAYEDRRARQAHQEAEEAAQRERMTRHARRQHEPRQHRQQQQQQLQQQQLQQLHLDDRQQQPHHLSPAEVQARLTLFQRLQAAGSMRGMSGRLPPPGQHEHQDEYTEQDTEMLLGTSSDEEEAQDSMLGGLTDESMRRRTRAAARGRDRWAGADAASGANGDGDGSGRAGAAIRGQNRVLQLTPTPMGDVGGAAGRGARTREERIGIGRRGARGA